MLDCFMSLIICQHNCSCVVCRQEGKSLRLTSHLRAVRWRSMLGRFCATDDIPAKAHVYAKSFECKVTKQCRGAGACLQRSWSSEAARLSLIQSLLMTARDVDLQT